MKKVHNAFLTLVFAYAMTGLYYASKDVTQAIIDAKNKRKNKKKLIKSI